MAERKNSASPSSSSKGGAVVFAKQVQRTLSRAQEKVLQKFGKSEETRDGQFEICAQNLQVQQSDGQRIYKDLKAYLNAVKVMRDASSRLFQSLFDAYELDWDGGEDLGAVVEGEDLLWNDYETKLRDQALVTMDSYMSQFPDIRERVAKRGRKLVDYDSARHNLASLESAKKRDDIKINKAKEETETAKKIFEDMNQELKEELPVLYDSRIGCYVTVFHAISNLRNIFYREMTQNNDNLQNIMKDLKDQHPDKNFVIKNFSRGSLKRRSLKDALSPRSLRSSFFDFHMGYSPRGTLRREYNSSFRSERGSYESYSPATSPTRPKPTEEPTPAYKNTDTSSTSEDHSTPPVTDSGHSAHSAAREDVKPENEEKEKKEETNEEESQSHTVSEQDRMRESPGVKDDLALEEDEEEDEEDDVSELEPNVSHSEAPENHSPQPEDLKKPGSAGVENGITADQRSMDDFESSKDTARNDHTLREVKEETV